MARPIDFKGRKTTKGDSADEEPQTRRQGDKETMRQKCSLSPLLPVSLSALRQPPDDLRHAEEHEAGEEISVSPWGLGSAAPAPELESGHSEKEHSNDLN